jgi:hypothetical protein
MPNVVFSNQRLIFFGGILGFFCNKHSAIIPIPKSQLTTPHSKGHGSLSHGLFIQKKPNVVFSNQRLIFFGGILGFFCMKRPCDSDPWPFDNSHSTLSPGLIAAKQTLGHNSHTEKPVNNATFEGPDEDMPNVVFSNQRLNFFWGGFWVFLYEDSHATVNL